MYYIIMGVSGSGKSTIGQMLATELNLSFKDADDFHPAENVAKMSRGEALNDDDRAPWLAAIGAYIDRHKDVVVTCSALKRQYRDTLTHKRPNGLMIFLDGTEALIHQRMNAREGHFMPLTLLKSQLATLEPPQNDENILIVSIEGGPEEILEKILSSL